MKAYNFVERMLEKCGYDQTQAGKCVKESLVRLTKNYDGAKLEELITRAIKGDIFVYVFFPEHTPGHTIRSVISSGLSFQIISSYPTREGLPVGSNRGYMLVRSDSGEFSDLYFVNRYIDSECPIIRLHLTSETLTALVLNLYPDKTKNVYETINSLSANQIEQIKKITGYVPMTSYPPGTVKEPVRWRALEPSQAYAIISDPSKAVELSPWQKGFWFNIDNLWIVRQEADELLASLKAQENLVAPKNIIPEESQKETKGSTYQSPPPPPKSNKRTRKRCPKLLAFVKTWIDRGYSYGDFAKEMVEIYLVKSRPEDDETFNDHDAIKRVYLIHKEGNNYKVHYSLVNPSGKLMPKRNPPALSSFKRIFADIEKQDAGVNQE